MDVTVGKTGKNETPFSIDLLSAGSAKCFNILRTADDNDLVASDCNSFRPWLILFHGVFSGVLIHLVWGFLRVAICSLAKKKTNASEKRQTTFGAQSQLVLHF